MLLESRCDGLGDEVGMGVSSAIDQSERDDADGGLTIENIGDGNRDLEGTRDADQVNA
jgi:hypothetical protein